MTDPTLTQSLIYIVQNQDKEDEPAFLEHIANVYKQLRAEDPDATDDVLVDEFTIRVNQTNLLITMLDTKIPAPMSIRAVELLSDDDDHEWFLNDD